MTESLRVAHNQKEQFGDPNQKQDKFKFKFQSESNYSFLKIRILFFRL